MLPDGGDPSDGEEVGDVTGGGVESGQPPVHTEVAANTPAATTPNRKGKEKVGISEGLVTSLFLTRMSLRLLLILQVTWPPEPVEVNAQLRVLLTMLLDSQNGRQGLCSMLFLRTRRVLMNRYSPKLPLFKRLLTKVLLKGQMQRCLPPRKLMNYMSLLLLRPEQPLRPEWPLLQWPWASQMFLQVSLSRLVGQSRLIG